MKPLNRRQLLCQGAVATGAWLALGAGAQPKPEKRRITIAVDGKASLQHLPLTIALQLGYFREEGLDVGLADVAPGSPEWQGLSTGAVDVVSGAFEHTLLLQARGQAVQSFVLQGRTPQTVLGVSPKALPYFRGAIDLKGRRIGISAKGSATHRLAHQVLSNAGVPLAQVRFVELGTDWTAFSAFRAGDIDALCHVDPTVTLLEQRGEIRVVADMRSLKETTETFGGPMPASCLYSSADFMQKHPLVCQALANAMVHALKWLQTAGPSDLIKTVPEAFMFGDRALYLAAFNKVRHALAPDGLMPATGPQTVLKNLASFDLEVRPDKVNLQQAYTNEMAQRAKEKFKA